MRRRWRLLVLLAVALAMTGEARAASFSKRSTAEEEAVEKEAVVVEEEEAGKNKENSGEYDVRMSKDFLKKNIRSVEELRFVLIIKLFLYGVWDSSIWRSNKFFFA